jgi:hypothetical protein
LEYIKEKAVNKHFFKATVLYLRLENYSPKSAGEAEIS